MHFQPIILLTAKSHNQHDEIDKLLQSRGVDVSGYSKHIISSDKNSIGIEVITKLKAEIYKKKDTTQIYIIQEAHKMTEEAQNALLKTLEEPPKHSLLILLANNRDLLLRTIRSRCLEIDLSADAEGTDIEPNLETFSNFINSDFMGRSAIIEEIVKNERHREFALDLILYIMKYARENRIELADQLMDIYKGLKQGSNVKLALENANMLLE